MPTKLFNYPYSLLFLFSLAAFSCDESSHRSGQTYLYVADDFSLVSVEAAPRMDEEEASERFYVYELDENAGQPIAPYKIEGNYHMENDRLVFTPKHPFESGKTYRARFERNLAPLDRDFFVRGIDEKPVAEVVRVYPSSRLLMQNAQRIYIEFSYPMAPGYAHENIYFVDEYGDMVHNVFEDGVEEKWFQEGKLLRIDFKPIDYTNWNSWANPLNSRFRPFENYRLIVESDMRDAAGRKLTNDHSKTYHIHRPIVTKAVNFRLMKTPKAGTKIPAFFSAMRSHDYRDMLHNLKVTDKEGNEIEGKLEITDFESSIIFHPKEPWKETEYRLLARAFMRDIAGNTRQASVKDIQQYEWFDIYGDSNRIYPVVRFWPRFKETKSRFPF